MFTFSGRFSSLLRATASPSAFERHLTSQFRGCLFGKHLLFQVDSMSHIIYMFQNLSESILVLNDLERHERMTCIQNMVNLQLTSQCQGEPHTQGGGSFYRALVME